MPHSPPVPPANQSPYPLVELPLVEPPHDHHASPAAPSPTVDRASSERRVRTGIAAALGIGAIAALVAGIVAASRQSPASPAPKRKPKGPAKKKR